MSYEFLIVLTRLDHHYAIYETAPVRIHSYPNGHILVSHINESVSFSVGPWCNTRFSNGTDKIYMMNTDPVGIIITVGTWIGQPLNAFEPNYYHAQN